MRKFIFGRFAKYLAYFDPPFAADDDFHSSAVLVGPRGHHPKAAHCTVSNDIFSHFSSSYSGNQSLLSPSPSPAATADSAGAACQADAGTLSNGDELAPSGPPANIAGSNNP